MKYFIPEDFYGVFERQIDREYASNAANEKLKCCGKVIYGSISESMNNLRDWSMNKSNYTTHKAIVINIQLIEKCEHPNEKVGVCMNPCTGIKYYKCYCGIEVIPSTFKVK